MGLILCKEMVERNRGKIFAESKVGEGTTFTFSLPKV
ncbi:MAG: ATP-binding protein [Bacteroidota bacterium]